MNCKELKFDFEVEGDYLIIDNGNAGPFKFLLSATVIAPCDNSMSVLCDNSDETEYLKLIDTSCTNNGFNDKQVSLYYKDFGLESKQALIDGLNQFFGIPLICSSRLNQLTVDNDKIFCS